MFSNVSLFLAALKLLTLPTPPAPIIKRLAIAILFAKLYQFL
jgi:hypothetical protein